MQSRIAVPLEVSRRSIATLIGGVIVLNLFVLLATYLHDTIPYEAMSPTAAWRVDVVLSEFTIVGENRIGVWYASMLLLSVSLVALVCFALDGRRDRTREHGRLLNYGWLFFAIVFAGLSLDEAGSLHERIGLISGLNPFQGHLGGWLGPLLIPILVVGSGLLAFAWFRVRRSRAAFLLMVLGVFCFLSIPLQEHVEFIIRRASEGVRPTGGLLLEEGTEIFGSLCFLASAALYAWWALATQVEEGARKPRADGYLTITFHPRVGSALLTATALAGMAAVGALIIRFGVLPFVPPQPHRGDPLNWFPGALAFLLAVGCLYIWATMRGRAPSSSRIALPFLVLGLFSLFLSFNHGSDYFFTEQLWNDVEGRSLLVDALVAVGALLVAALFWFQSFPRLGRIAVAGWALLLSAALFVEPAAGVPLSLAAYALLCPALVLTFADLQSDLSDLPSNLPSDTIGRRSMNRSFAATAARG